MPTGVNQVKFQKYIEIAKGLFPSDFTNKTFHVTFLVKNRKIIKIGLNSYKTHPRNLRYAYKGKADNVDIRRFVAVHSELSAVLKYGKEDCSDCTFINVRIDKNGEATMSEPCNGCKDLLSSVGFKKIYFTNKQGEFEEWQKD